MKNVLLLLLVLAFVISAVGCNHIPSAEPDNTGDITEQNNEQPLHHDDYDKFEPDISLLDDVYRNTIELQDVKLSINDAQLLDTSPIYFTEVLGTRKRYPNSLPVITGFQYPYVFYERMTVVVEDANRNDAALYVGRYSVETKEAQEFAIESFTGISDEARLVVDEDRIVYMYSTLDEQGNLKMNIKLFDYLNNTQKIISAHSAHNVFGYAKKLCEDELIFFLYESVSSGTQQIILHYDLQTETLNEIYRGQNMTGYSDSSTSTKDIWAIDAGNGNIDLLMQQFVDGKMVSYLRTIDEEGQTVYEEELSALSRYDSLEDNADSLVIKGDYAFIHYSQFNKSEDNTNAPFAILRKVNSDYRLLDIDGDIMPKMLSGIGSPDIPYVFYHLYESAQTLFAFNVNTGEGFLLELPGDGIQNFAMDTSGNLLIAARTDEKTNWYFFPSERVLKELK